MPAPSSDMIQSVKVKIHKLLPFTHQFSQTDINSLVLGKKHKIRLTNPAMINYLRNSTNLSSLTPLINITPNYTQLIQQSSDLSVSLSDTNTYTYGTSAVLIDPGNGSNLGSYSTNAFIYMSGSSASWLTIVNNILTNSFILQNSQSNPPTSQLLTQNNNWLPNEYGSGPSYWYNCSLWTGDYICQQIIVYAALYAYINTIIKGQMVIPQVYMNLYTNILCSVGGAYPDGWDSPPYNVGNIVFSTNWPFELNSIILNSYLSPMTPGQQPSTFPANQQNSVPYDSYGGNLPPGLSGLTTLDENDMLNLFQINMPIVIGSNSSQVNNYSSNPTGIVSLTESSNAILMNFIATGTTTVTINNVSFNVTIPSVPINFSSWQEYPPYGDNSGYPMFTSTQMWQIPQETVTFGQWYLNIYTPNFTPSLPYAYQNAITMVFTSSNTNLPIVDFNDNNPMTATNNVSDLAGQYVSAGLDLGNNGQTSTITATAYLFGQIIPNASYTYTYTFTLPNWSPYHYPHL